MAGSEQGRTYNRRKQVDRTLERRKTWLATACSKACSEGTLETVLVERDLERMSRERFLPDEKTLEKNAHYEAHISRGLYKVRHEQEAFQTRCLGGVAPLVRPGVEV